jgi:hypothetical protein
MAISAQELQKQKIQAGEISSFFDCLSDILLKFSGGNLVNAENFNKCFSPYMLCRYISMRPSLINYAEYLNNMQTVLTYKEFYLLAYHIIPKQKTGFIKYIKKAKSETEKNLDEINSNNSISSILFDL